MAPIQNIKILIHKKQCENKIIRDFKRTLLP